MRGRFLGHEPDQSLAKSVAGAFGAPPSYRVATKYARGAVLVSAVIIPAWRKRSPPSFCTAARFVCIDPILTA